MNKDGSCNLAGPGRGDCAHAVGLPGINRPGQHDGPDDTVDVYGKPNGWCWYCWQSWRLMEQHAEIKRLREENKDFAKRNAPKRYPVIPSTERPRRDHDNHQDLLD